MKPWLIPVLLAAAGLAWLEFRRPDARHRTGRIAAVLVAVAAFIVLLTLRPERRGLTLLTPGAPVTARSRDAVTLEQAQTLANAGERRRPVRLVGWGLLAHEWPAEAAAVTSFEPAELPVGVVMLEQPAEVAVGEPLQVRGRVHGAGAGGSLLLEDPAGPRDSATVSDAAPDFMLVDRPRAPGAVEYRLRLRLAGRPEVVETLSLSVRRATMPAVLVLDASPSFETATLKRWLADRGAAVTVRTRVSRDRFRTEMVNGAPAVEKLAAATLAPFDAVLLDGGMLAVLPPGERAELERQVRERGLGLLLTADAPSVLSAGAAGVLGGYGVGGTGQGSGERRLVRPAWAEAPRRSRTGIDAEPATLTGGDPLLLDQGGGTLAATRHVGRGAVAVTLLRTPSRWLLENEADRYSAYWFALLGAITRDTLTRVTLSADGPLRPDHPVRVTLTRVAPDSSALPVVTIRAPDGRADTLALGQSPFDPATSTGRYWPRVAGWHRVELGGGRNVPFRVTAAGEWQGLEASARLTATRARVAGPGGNAERREPGALLGPLAFAALVLALTWLWVEGRRAA